MKTENLLTLIKGNNYAKDIYINLCLLNPAYHLALDTEQKTEANSNLIDVYENLTATLFEHVGVSTEHIELLEDLIETQKVVLTFN